MVQVRAHFDGTVFVPDEPVDCPANTPVRLTVEPVKCESKRRSDAGGARSALFCAGERAKPTGMPDLAINHDHYLYGHPKVTRE